MVSGFTTVAPWSGLAKSCDPAMALIHASEMERLGPGPVTAELNGPDGGRRRRAAAARRAARGGRGRGGAGSASRQLTPAVAWRQPIRLNDLHLGIGRSDRDQVAEGERPVDGRVEDRGPSGDAGRVGVVGRHHQVVLRNLGIQRGDVGLQRVDIVLCVVHLVELPRSEEGQQRRGRRRPPTASAPGSSSSCIRLATSGGSRLNFLTALSGSGRARPIGVASTGPTSLGLLLAEVQLRGVEPGQR